MSAPFPVGGSKLLRCREGRRHYIEQREGKEDASSPQEFAPRNGRSRRNKWSGHSFLSPGVIDAAEIAGNHLLYEEQIALDQLMDNGANAVMA